MVFAVLFMLSMFDIALFEGQCAEYCGDCYSSTNIFKVFCSQNATADGCLRGCERRGVACDFDPLYKKNCEGCLEGCRKSYTSGSEGFENCSRGCFG